MMKKYFMLLAVLFVVAMPLSVSAATTNSFDNSATDETDVIVNVADENGNEIKEEDVTKVYKVDVTWDDLTFDFTCSVATEDLVYDTDTHTYTNIAGTWAKTEATVLVENHSNDEVSIKTTMTNDGIEVYGVTATLEEAADNSEVLDSAAGLVDAPSNLYTVSVDGVPTLFDITVATVTVEISVPEVTE